MSASFNNSSLPSASSIQAFLPPTVAASRPNHFHREGAVLPMIQLPTPAVAPPPKRRRNQPGNPNPDAEVIALSPRTIMATNRFVCEVCNKGFQREQNLQLHRRGHNLPWKLKQKSTTEVVRRKVYLCPEPTCVHHDPGRALGDLTGIKKHFFRKHGEKRYKCDKCSKRYAVQSDWKAHSKTCGTKEYKCDCGTIFSRRDSYITHRAFCDVLSHETARNPPVHFTAAMAAAAAGGCGGGRAGIYGASGLSPFANNNPNPGYGPLGGYNPSSVDNGFIPHSTNPSPAPTNLFMQTSQGLIMARNNLMNHQNQHGLLGLGDVSMESSDDNLFRQLVLCAEHKYTKNSDQPSLFTNGAVNNDPSGLLRGLTSSSSSSMVVSDYGDTDHNGNLQGLMNSLAATADHQPPQGRSGGAGIYDLHFGNGLTMGGSDRLTLDFLGVNGGMMRNNVNGRPRAGPGGGGGAPLDVGMKFPNPNHPYGKP